MRIRTKYIGFLCLFIFMFTGLILGLVQHMKRLNTKNVKEMLSYQNENEMMYGLELSLNKLIMPANDYLIHGGEEEKYAFDDLVADVNRKFDILEGGHYPTRIMVEERELLARLKDQYVLVRSLAEKIFDIPNPIGSEEGARLMEEMDLLVDKMTEEAMALNRKTYLVVLTKVEAIDAQLHRYTTIVLYVLVVVIVSTGLYGLFFIKGIVIPIRRVVECMDNVAMGDFSQRLDIKTKDEMGTLAERFNWMIEKIKISYGTIKAYSNKLEDSEKQFRLLAENIPGISWMSDSKLNEIIYVSPAYEEIIGRTCKSLYEKPKSFLEVVHPDDLEYILAAIKKYEQGVYNVEYRIVWSDSSVRWIWAHAFPLRNEQGKIYRMIGIAQDITERKRIEVELSELTNTLEKRVAARTMELTESEEKFRCITTSARDAIIMTDNDSKISYWNEAAERIFGFSKEEAVGKYVHRILVPERLREDASEGYKRFKDTGRGLLIGKTIEVTAIKKDGTEVPIAISLSATMIKGKWNAIGIIRDITKRKHAEETIRHQREFLNDIISSIPYPLYVIDAHDYSIKMVNKAVSPTGQFTDMACYELSHKRNKPCEGEHICVLEKVKRTKKTVVVEHLHYDRDGNPRNVEVHGHPIFDEKGNVIQMIELFIDITERKHIEEQLRVSYKMASLGRLTAGVSHEILNPINIISLHVQLLLAEAENGSKVEKALKSIREEIERVVKITDGLLGFARKGKLITEEVDTNSLLEKILSIVESDMKLENVKIMRRFEDKLPRVVANSDEMRQVFLNMITNASDAMPEGGTLTISTQSIKERGKPFVTVKFIDTGIGIKKNVLDKVFDPFFTTKEEGEGTGLGLSTSYGIIENHGGKMSVKSKEGKGATFRIDLPVKD